MSEKQIEELNQKPEEGRKAKKESFKGLGLKKLDSESFKLLTALREKANKKDFGRRVRDSEILGLGLTLIEAKHIAELQERTLTHQDRLKIAHAEYQKTHGKLSLDAFIGKLLVGEIKK